MKLDTITQGDFLKNDLPDKCANLIIGDPPYYRVKGDFDFVWPSFDAYLEDVEKWAVECARLLADNGTLLWWGDHEHIAYSQVIFDRHFTLLANCVWQKTDGHANKTVKETLRAPVNLTERFLMYESNSAAKGIQSFYTPNAADFFEGYEPIRLWLRDEINALGGAKKVGAALGISSRAVDHWTCRSQWCFPSPERVEQLLALYPPAEHEAKRQEHEAKRQEHEAKRQEHEAKRRPYFGELYGWNSVISASQEAHRTRFYRFPTKKPPMLTRRLIETMSRPGDLVFVPFAGSGTECEAAKLCGRHFIGYDIDARAVDISRERVARAVYEPNLQL